MMPLSISLSFFLLLFWLSFSLSLPLCFGILPSVVVQANQDSHQLAYHPGRKLWLFSSSLCGLYPFVFLQMLHTLLRSTKCVSVKGALLLSQVDICWIVFHIPLKPQPMNDMNCVFWERMHRPEYYRQIQTRLFWIDQEWAKSQTGSWTCCRDWQA